MATSMLVRASTGVAKEWCSPLLLFPTVDEMLQNSALRHLAHDWQASPAVHHQRLLHSVHAAGTDFRTFADLLSAVRSTSGLTICQPHLHRSINNIASSGSRYFSTASHGPIHESHNRNETIWTESNMLSVGRALSAPFIAGLILSEQWSWAVAATAISGLTDWADGAVARRYGQTSVLGSYLDPLADKILVGAVVGALAAQGFLPTWFAALIIGRDVGLVAGMAWHRWRSLGYKTRGLTAAEFFKTTPSTPNTAAGAGGSNQQVENQHELGNAVASSSSSAAAAVQGVPMMKPLLISKLNTVLQLILVCSCMSHAWLQVPDDGVVQGLEMVTAGTTAASMAAYVWMYASGRMLRASPSQTH